MKETGSGAEKAIEKEFEALNEKTKCNTSSKNLKLTGFCKDYNNLYQVWKFNIDKFSIKV